ncbi:MAG: M23 family metallopeptidase, partial [Oscillospiraceae bacterium]|nr:M23 family metallopeptidase [Oscillospiraceae bacterium]
TGYEEKRRSYKEYSKAQDTRPQKKADNKNAISAKRDRRRLWQMTVSAMILIGVIALKLLAPQSVSRYRETLLDLIGHNTDFVAVFSEVGRAADLDGGIKEVLNDAYVAVFGTADGGSQTGSNTGYSAENTPPNVCLTQQVLGFDYVQPVTGMVTDGFGYRDHPIDGDMRFHYGVDMEANSGDVIRSFADGTVTAVGESSDLGKYITVLHANGYTTLYAHCSRITASSAQQVKAGDPIAEAGDTGRATGPHLHFEMHRDTTYLNPVYYVS